MRHSMFQILSVFTLVSAGIVCGSACRAGDDDFSPVSPLDEVKVIDPRVDPEGKPRAVIQHHGNGNPYVDIPPTIIVHKYYYTGDREFQGPLIPGGPSIVVVNHPVSGERLYLEAQMLPGAPRITYRRHYIDFDFGEQAIRIRFGHLAHLGHAGTPTVSYREGESLAKEIAEARIKARTSAGHWITRTGLPHAVKSVGHGAVNVVNATADGIHTVGEFLVSPVVQIIDATPVGSIVHRSVEDAAINERDRAVAEATRESERLSGFIPTNR